MSSRTRSKFRIACLTLLALLVLLTCAGRNFGDWAEGLSFSVAAAAFVTAAVWLLAPPDRGPELPDILGPQLGRLYERDGLCFAPRLEVGDDRACRFRVYYQNRHDTPCHAQIYCIPMEGVSKVDDNHDVPPVGFTFHCAGGEVGVITVPYPIAPAWQGRIMIYDVMAIVRYPDGKGKLVRSGRGVPVGLPPSSDTFDPVVTSLALLAIGIVRIPHTRDAVAFETHLPADVATASPPGTGIESTILWDMSQWTEGFPVSPVATAESPCPKT